MDAVTTSQMYQWAERGNRAFPKALGLRCGHCRENCRFVVADPMSDFNVGGAPVQLACPNCHQPVHFWAVRAPRAYDPEPWLYVHPSTEHWRRLDLSALDWPEPLARAYEECVGAFEAGLWTAAVGQTRRTLEGVVKQLVADGSSRTTLGGLLKRLPQEVPLDRPILDAADALREGGNLASHFDLSTVTDEAVARAVLQLLEDLIEYLFLLPENVRELRLQLNPESDRSDVGESGDAS